MPEGERRNKRLTQKNANLNYYTTIENADDFKSK
jgi:hypothetical protein